MTFLSSLCSDISDTFFTYSSSFLSLTPSLSRKSYSW